MPIDKNDPRIVFKTIEEVSKPMEGMVNTYLNRWWSYDPERGIIFWKPRKERSLYPQCNHHEGTSRILTAKMYPWATIIHVPVVFTRLHLADYMD